MSEPRTLRQLLAPFLDYAVIEALPGTSTASGTTPDDALMVEPGVYLLVEPGVYLEHD
jgi:hypothetical protein